MIPNPDHPKRKNRAPQRAIVNLWGCTLSVIMLGIGITLGLAAALFAAPVLLQLDITQTVQAETALHLAATAADIEQREQAIPLQLTEAALAFQATDARLLQRATQAAQPLQVTAAALANEAALLQQTSTQSASFIAATATANADLSARQRTQAALDQASTQAALQQNATAIEIDFRNTQAALGLAPNATATTQVAAIILPSATGTTTNPFVPLQIDFGDESPSNWVLSSTDAWNRTADGLQAVRDDAWGLTRTSYSRPYQVQMTFQPSLANTSAYTALLNVGAETGLALRITAMGLEANSAAIYQFDVEQLTSGRLEIAQMQRLERAFINVLLVGNTQLEVTLADGQLRANLNGDEILATVLDDDSMGAVGFYATAGAELRRLAITEVEQ